MAKTKTQKKKKDSAIVAPDAEKKELELAYLNANQALCLSAILLNASDDKAMQSLKWGKTKYYRVKGEVKHLKKEFAQEFAEDTMFTLSLAGKHAVLKYIELLNKGSNDFQKSVADEIMDRTGITKKDPEQAGTPVVQNIIANKWDKYEEN